MSAPPRKLLDQVCDAVRGLDWTPEDMMRAGERAWNLKRAIARLGYGNGQAFARKVIGVGVGGCGERFGGITVALSLADRNAASLLINREHREHRQ